MADLHFDLSAAAAFFKKTFVGLEASGLALWGGLNMQAVGDMSVSDFREGSKCGIHHSNIDTCGVIKILDRLCELSLFCLYYHMRLTVIIKKDGKEPSVCGGVG